MTFHYRPLGDRCIRLLTVDPSPLSTQPLACHLRHVALDDLRHAQAAADAYEALSYVWGARHGTVPVICDGQTVLVTPNCASALRHLRRQFRRRVLWIDAICIDQQSVAERNQQVPLMGEIYETAARVIIWLGPSLRQDEDLFRHARIGGALYQVRGVPKEKILPRQRSRRWVSKIINEEELESVRRLCANPWFTRVWTIQELLLTSAAVFQIGQAECPSVRLYSYIIVAETFASSSSSSLLLPDLHRLHMRTRAQEIVHPRVAWGASSMHVDMTVSLRSPEHDPSEFMTLLWRMVDQSDASDARDKIYGMRGLLQKLFPQHGAGLPAVDYGQPVQQVFEEATRSLIRTTQSLWPLEMVVHPGNNSDDLPSWVPDLRDPAAIRLVWQPGLWRGVATSAKMNIPARCRLTTKLEKYVEERGLCKPVEPEMDVLMEHEPGRLPVQAKHLAEVASVYNRMPVVGGEENALRVACLSEWAAAMAATPMANETADLAALDRLTPALHGRLKHVQSSVYDGAVLFRTACGLLGLCKGNVRPDDGIWQLVGGRYPFVLRLCDQMHYRLVGIADVVGLDAEDRSMAWEKKHTKAHFHEIVLV